MKRYIKTKRLYFQYNNLDLAVKSLNRIRRSDPAAKILLLKDHGELEGLDSKRLVEVEG